MSDESGAGSAVPDSPGVRTPTTSVMLIDFSELQINTEIGEGAYKTVYSGFWAGNPVAIVRINQGVNKLEREVLIMQRLSNHPNLVQLYGISVSGNDTYLVMELLPYGALDAFLQKGGADNQLTGLEKLLVAQQICNGMSAVALEGVVHADLAARNVLVFSTSPPVIKLADFGLSKLALQYYGTVSGGIPVRWSSPEVMMKGKWSEKSDIWAYGVTLWEIYAKGTVPYGNRTGFDVQQLVCSGHRLPRPKGCPELVYQVMLATWHQNPSGRPSFRQLRKKLAELVTMVQNGEMETEFEDDGDEATFDWQVDDNKDKDKDEKEKEGSK